jgi:hypothetical protein
MNEKPKPKPVHQRVIEDFNNGIDQDAARKAALKRQTSGKAKKDLSRHHRNKGKR